MSNENLKFCIIIPCYERHALTLEKTIEGLKEYQVDFIIVDDGSSEEYATLIREITNKYNGALLVNQSNGGKGAATKAGLLEAYRLGYTLGLQVDADGQHDPDLIAGFVKMTERYDVIIGSRFIEGGSTPNFSYRRKIMSKVGNFLIRYLGGAYVVKDCTSGYRVIRKEVLEKCELSTFPTKGYSFQSWLICELVRKGAVIKEMPIIFNKRLTGDSKLTFGDQLEFLVNIARIRFANSEDFVKYCLVGGSGVLVNLSVYYSLTRFLDINAFLSSPIAIWVSILTNFLLNNYWTFRNRPANKSILSRLLNFHVVAGIAGLINYIMFVVLISLLSIHDLLAVLFGIVAGIVFNYTGNSLWTFRKKIKKPKALKGN